MGDKAIYEFHWDCGRMGDLDGIFIASKSDVYKAIGKGIYFGEVLGKHSEIFGTLDEEDLTLKSDDPSFVEKVIETFGEGTMSGYNPLEYIEDSDDEED